MVNNADYLNLQARPELLEEIENIARDKSIPIDYVFEAMETALKRVAHAKYGTLYDIRVKVNRQNGAIVAQKVLTVVEDSEVEDSYFQIPLSEAVAKKADAVLGDEIVEILPALDFVRSYVQPFRQIINRKVREAEKEKEYELYKEKEKELASGIVKRIEFGNALIDLGNGAEGFLRRDFFIPAERLDVGQRIRSLILEVRQDVKGPQIILSRNHPDFIKKLFQQEIPEVYEGVIEVKRVARDAGSRSKVAVYSSDPSIDPIGTCVGFKGSRIQGILGELNGEKIDLVRYSDNIIDFLMNAFHPLEIVKVVVNNDNHFIETVVKDETLSLAIGRKGQNISLISKLIGWHIYLIGETEDSKKRQQHIQEKSAEFVEILDVDDVIAQLLVVEGFNSVEDIVKDTHALSSIPAFNDEIIQELKERCKEYIKERDEKYLVEIENLKVSEELQELISKPELLVYLGRNDVKTLDDFADLSTFDLLDILPEKAMTKDQAESLILQVRSVVYG